jgi:hypothetical protein
MLLAVSAAILQTRRYAYSAEELLPTKEQRVRVEAKSDPVKPLLIPEKRTN